MKEKAKAKNLLWVVSMLGLLVIGSIVAWRYFKKDLQSGDLKVKRVVTKGVQNVVTKATDSLYRVTFSDFNLKIDSGYADITGFSLVADTNILRKLQNERRIPNNIVTAKAAKITCSNIALQKVEGEQTLLIGKMRIDHINVDVTNRVQSYNDTSHDKSMIASAVKSIFKSIDTDNIMEVKVDQVSMDNFTLAYHNENEKPGKTTTLRNLDITLTDVSSGALANKHETQKYDAAFKIGHQKIVTADKLYDIDFDNIRLVPADKKIFVGSFSLTPRIGKAAFVKAVKAGRANYRYHLKYTGISMNEIDFDRLARRQQFFIPNVTIDDSWMELYTNYNWPLRTPPNRRDKFPNELLQQLAFDVTIKKMIQKHGDMYFKIVARASQKEAVFTINDVFSTSTNITNNRAVISGQPYSTVVSESKLMNTGRMHSKMVFNLRDKKAPVSITSTLGAMDGTAFNPLSEALSLMKIEAARIEKMHTRMNVDEYRATGNVDFFYKDMKVRLLKKDKEEDSLKKRPLLSFFANLVLPNDNPKKNGKFRKGPVNVVRDPKESFFGFVWRAMLDGMSSAISGMDQDKKEPGNTVVEMSSLFTGPKQGVEQKSAGGDKERLERIKGKKRKNTD